MNAVATHTRGGMSFVRHRQTVLITASQFYVIIFLTMNCDGDSIVPRQQLHIDSMFGNAEAVEEDKYES